MSKDKMHISQMSFEDSLKLGRNKVLVLQSLANT